MRTYFNLAWIIFLLAAHPLWSQIKVHPSGVNVNASDATTVFLTFGRLTDQVPVEAFWCGELTDAAPDVGKKCDPGTIFGRLPIRYDLSRLNPDGSYTDIMSIPPSVARRAYQAAQQGQDSQFFYVRRFSSLKGGPDEYVAVTCRMTGGGARAPFALLDVKITTDTDLPVYFVKKGTHPPQPVAEIYYNGTGVLKGRWEVVLPGDEPPTGRDLLPEASLPINERGTQRRYTEISRFNVFLPPVGKYILTGPKPKKLPSEMEGLYMLILRIEASDDKEADSNLASVGGRGLVHSGAVAGFPLPPFRYFVGNVENELFVPNNGELSLLLPGNNAKLPADEPIDFNWVESRVAAFYRLEIKNSASQVVLSAILQSGVGSYRAPSWIKDRLEDDVLGWRVVGLDFSGKEMLKSEWRILKLIR